MTFNVHLLASVEEFTNEVVRMGQAVLMEMPPEEPVSADNNSLENSSLENSVSEMPVDPSNPNNAAAQPQPVQPKTLYFSWQG